MLKKHCLVTGNLGFIASHLVERLQQDGHVVSGCDVKNMIDVRDYKFHERYDVIFHLAAKASIPASERDPLESHTHNVVGVLRLLEHARKSGSLFVFSSSSSIYGVAEEPTLETELPKPMTPYAFQKWEAEQYCQYYWNLGVRSCALRYFNVYGEGQERANEGENPLVLTTFLNQKKLGQPLTIVGDGEQRRDFVYVKDVVEANVAAAKWLKTANDFEAFNVGSGQNYSINEIAEIIDPGGQRSYLPARREPRSNLADVSKIRSIGWQPKTSLVHWLGST